VQRLCFYFHKAGDLRFLSHLELVRSFTRAMRRAGLPLAYSQGYNPQPRVSVASALPVGVAGLREPAEVELRERVDPGAFAARLNGQLPEGLRVLGAWEAPVHGGEALGQRVRGALYSLTARANGAAAHLTPAACEAFLARPSIVLEVFKKGKMVPVDVRPFIRGFRPSGDGQMPEEHTDALRWELTLHAGPGGSVRPQAIFRSFLEAAVPAEAVGEIEATLQVTRTALEIDGAA
jgi:radical SAM-linked protein